VFGGELAAAGDRAAAVTEVRTNGLAALTETWWHHRDSEWVAARIQEASPGTVRALVGNMPDTRRP